ncbi:MAG TPA: hypothetical protein VI391_01530 [Thermoanaerobaculia bacterium]
MNDNSLRNAFAELRRVEAAKIPPFRAAGQARLPVLHRYAFAAIVLLIVIGVALLPHRSAPPQPSITAWRAPTDFLLQTPGRELLNSVPDLKGKRQ